MIPLEYINEENMEVLFPHISSIENAINSIEMMREVLGNVEDVDSFLAKAHSRKRKLEADDQQSNEEHIPEEKPRVEDHKPPDISYEK